MIKKQTLCSIRWIALIVVICILSSGIGFFLQRGDVRFLLFRALHANGEPDLCEFDANELFCEVWTEANLLADERVTLTRSLMLINESHPLPEDYQPLLTNYNGALMYPPMVEPYVALRNAVQEKTGIRIYVSSDYRTAEEQKDILTDSADGIAAQIGCSEHEAGLALDVYAPYFSGMDFLKSSAGRMVNRVCGEYGYIIRYERGKESITGISYEPWHLRYVGVPHAEIMADSRLTLEEYLEQLTPEVWYAHGNYLILRTAKESVALPQQWERLEISPDNTGYRVLTLKVGMA